MEDEVGGDQDGGTLSSDVRIGEFCSSDIQVAINEGNRHRHAFFVVKMVKTGVTVPYQQVIPADFSKYHPRLHLEVITLEGSCGRSWGVTIRSLNNVCRFGKGWRQFSVENHLRVGHQLLFHLVGKSTILVRFFDHMGKSHYSFPPLTPCGRGEEDAPPFAEPSPQSETLVSKPPPLPVATPLESTPVATPLETSGATPLESTPVAAPFETVPVAAFPSTKPTTPRPRTPGLRSDDAKVILRRFLKMAEDIDGRKQGSYEEQATEEGKAYVFISSDDDDEPVKQESLARTPIRRDSVQESDSGEQTAFHSPEKVRMPRLAGNTMPVEYVEQDGFDNHSSRSKSNSDNKYGFEDYLKELVSDHGPTVSAVQSDSLAPLSPAEVLLTQQGCLNYSEIVSKRRRGHVTDEARQRPLTAATRYAAGLKTQSFLVVMEDHHVYHGFQLSIPRDFLEATGTLRANEVQVYLMDNQRNCHETNWKWQAGCQTPFLNCDGWALFALDHMLEEGDVCVFELVGPGPAFLIPVHIFKIVAAEINSRRDSFIHGGQSASLNQKFGRQAAAAANNADQELMRHDRNHSKKVRPIVGLGRPSLQKTIQKPYNLQAWTKLFKPRVRAQFQKQSS